MILRAPQAAKIYIRKIKCPHHWTETVTFTVGVIRMKISQNWIFSTIKIVNACNEHDSKTFQDHLDTEDLSNIPDIEDAVSRD
jgi:hypothetical protein